MYGEGLDMELAEADFWLIVYWLTLVVGTW